MKNIFAPKAPVLFTFQKKVSLSTNTILHYSYVSQSLTWTKGIVVPLALLSFWSTIDFKQNKMDFEEEMFLFFPFHFYWLCEKDQNKDILSVAHFPLTPSQSTTFQSFLVFAFPLK